MLHLKGIPVHGMDHDWSCSYENSQMFAMDRTRTSLGPSYRGSDRSQLSGATVPQALSNLYIQALAHHKSFCRYNTFSFSPVHCQYSLKRATVHNGQHTPIGVTTTSRYHGIFIRMYLTSSVSCTHMYPTLWAPELSCPQNANKGLLLYCSHASPYTSNILIHQI